MAAMSSDSAADRHAPETAARRRTRQRLGERDRRKGGEQAHRTDPHSGTVTACTEEEAQSSENLDGDQRPLADGRELSVLA